MKQGDLFWIEAGGKTRPGLVVTRTVAIPVLKRVLVAPLTTTIRGIPTEIPIDRSTGLHSDSVAAMDNLTVVPKAALTERIGSLPNPDISICRALEAMAGC